MDQKGAYPHPQPPPAYGFDQQQQQQNVYPMQPYIAPVVVEHQPQVHIIASPPVGPEPSMVTCPSCRNQVVTRMEYESSTKTHIIAGLLCLFGCWCCVCVPYCVDSCQNGNHYCPSCGAYIGTYSG